MDVEDIRRRNFSRCFRGLNPQEVQSVLEQAAENMGHLHKESETLRHEVEEQKDLQEYRGREQSLEAALAQIRQVSESIKSNAEREAQLVIAEAELQAEKTLSQAHNRLAQIHNDIAELKRQRAQFEVRCAPWWGHTSSCWIWSATATTSWPSWKTRLSSYAPPLKTVLAVKAQDGGASFNVLVVPRAARNQPGRCRGRAFGAPQCSARGGRGQRRSGRALGQASGGGQGPGAHHRRRAFPPKTFVGGGAGAGRGASWAGHVRLPDRLCRFLLAAWTLALLCLWAGPPHPVAPSALPASPPLIIQAATVPTGGPRAPDRAGNSPALSDLDGGQPAPSVYSGGGRRGELQSLGGSAEGPCWAAGFWRCPTRG
ncbi:cell division initiation protein [Desulfarculales bacterium]